MRIRQRDSSKSKHRDIVAAGRMQSLQSCDVYLRQLRFLEHRTEYHEIGP